ncbi:MAG TPA: hypothetical protein VF483_13050, partial [Gemmatimonadaceae bacterium]
MKRIAFFAAVSLAVAACAPASTTTSPAPKPAPAPPAAVTPAPRPAPAAPETPVIREAPLNWHLLDATADGMAGISALRAERELLKDRQPQRVVIVAVIDGGVDTAHAALKPHLWLNAKEIPGNGKDDDKNGFVDDTRGWNFIGGKDGKNVNEDTFEVTRLAALCADSTAAGKARMPTAYRDKCPSILAEVTQKHGEAEQTLGRLLQIEELFSRIVPILKKATGSDSLS